MKEILENLDCLIYICDREKKWSCLNEGAFAVVFGGTSGPASIESIVSDEKLSYLNMGIEQVFDGIMPVEVSLSILPKKMTIENKLIELKYRAQYKKGTDVVECVILIMTDKTREFAKKSNDEREFLHLKTLVKILKSKQSFINFVDDYFKDCQTLKELEDEKVGFRILHTLKGNSSAFGLEDLAHLIHSIEDNGPEEIKEFGVQAFFEQVSYEIEANLDSFLAENFSILGLDRFDKKDALEVSREQLGSLKKMIQVLPNDDKVESLRQFIRSMEAQPISILFSSYEDTVLRIAERLEKKIRLVFEGEQTRVMLEALSPAINQLIHLIRNSCDHGIESPEKRAEAGKDEIGTILISVSELTGERVEILVRDDGQGIQIDKLKKKSIESGLLSVQKADSLTEQQALELVFADGVSTADSVNSTSGRGVGMAALKAEVERLGGTIRIVSEVGSGSEFRLVLPIGYDLVADSGSDATQTSGLVWNHTLKLGVDFIDEQHRQLVNYINALNEQSEHYINERPVALAEVKETLKKLIEYTIFHFDEEEAFMKKFKYPEFEAHKKIHEKLKAQVGEMAAAFQADGIAVLPRMVLFLNGWLKSHILKTDKKYAKHITSHYVVWNESLDLGIQEMDDQHQQLVEYLNEIKEIEVQASQGLLADMSQLREVIEKLIHYTVEHFEDEERLMEEHQYPDLERHKKLHQVLIKRAGDIKAKFDSEAESSIHEIVRLVESWIIHHIISEDKKYAIFIQNKKAA